MSSAIVFTTDPSEPDFDIDALREKYRAERDKRLRTDTMAQHQEPVGDFSKYVDDPDVEPGFTRAPPLMLSVMCSCRLSGLDWQRGTMRVSG